MNDAASSLLKVLSALTSPKASIKYIAVAVFVIFSWKYVSDNVVALNAPAQYVELISLFLGLGLGTLSGEVVYIVLVFVWEYFRAKLNRRKAAAERAAKEVSTLLAARNAEREFLIGFQKAYSYFNAFKRSVMSAVAVEETELELWREDVAFLTRQKYIVLVVASSDNAAVFKINPTIKDFMLAKKNEVSSA